MKKLAVICWLLAAGMAQAELVESSFDLREPLRVQNEASVSVADQPSTTVDILVAFDRNAAAYANRNGGVADFALTAVSKMNTVLANNGLDEQFRFRLVGTMEVAAEATDVHAALEAIRDSETGWAEIKTKRDEVGADIVTTLIDTGSAYGTTGASWPLTTMELASFADSAYNVCAIRAVEIGHAMTREVGHNMGAGNATEVADPDIRGPQLHDYSSGYYFTGSDGTRYRTIMADSADGYGNTYALAPLFSSPAALWDGTSAGDASHDNARTLRATCAAVSLWRAQKVAMSYDVFFSPETDTLFDEAVMVTLTPGKNGLDIRYTTDGSEPTLTSVRYSTPLKLTRTTTVKAAAVYDGRLGPVYTARYLKRDLATALNAPQLEWTTSPDDPWVAQSDDAFDGFAAKSCPKFVGNFGCGKTSWLKTTVTGPTEMGFRYQKTQYSSAFKVYCDDQVVWSDSENEAGIGGSGWHQAVVNLPEGTHEITFAFEQGHVGYDGFNGIVLDTVCFDAWSASPVIEPATTDDQATAKTFTGSMTVTLTPPAGRTGTLLYTLDGSDPTQEGALPYTGPFMVDKSVFVQAVFVEPGRDASAPARGYFLERHPMKPGEWTTDVEGVKEAARQDGRLIAVLLAHRADCGWTKAFMPVAESPEFLTWAEMNGVYLITADDSERVDTEAAKNYFRDLYSGQDAIFPMLVFADPSNPDVPLASGVARNDGVATIGGVPYDDTVESLVRGFAAVMDETSVPAAPTVSPESELVAGFPVMVTLENPNAYGTIYYTLDGSAPTKANGSLYTSPISIVSSDIVLKAVVWNTSGLSGLVLIKSYKTSSDVVGITLPTGMAGYGYVVSNLTAGTEIRTDNEGGYALPIGAKVGIYTVAEEGYVIVGTNPYVIDEVTIDTVIDASALPMALPPRVVTLGDHPHMTAAWTSGDGSVTNVIDGTGFKVAWGTTNVKVIFTADSGWKIVGDAVVDLGTVTENIVFGGESEYHVPEVAIADPCLVAFGRGSSNMAVAWTSGDGSVTNAVANKVKAMYVPRGSENVRIICTANPGYELVGESVFDLGTVTDDFTFGQGNDFVFPIAYDIAANVVYLDWDEANGRMTNAVARAGYWRSVEDSEMAYAMKGCMVVTNDVTIPIAQVAGAAVLVLCNDATLTVTGTGDEAGIHVPANASLTITVRKGSTGRVVAQGGADCAGIGSQFKQGSGSVLGAVRIVAGTVTATGGKNGAGIGNGFYGKDGSVKIFGGAVTAVGGVGAASDIGDGGNPYSPCSVSISGGIFARPVQEAWCADHFAVFDNLDPATKSDYPYAVLPASTLTIGKCPIHVSAAWTSVSPERSESPSGDGYQGCDGSVTNAIEGASVVMRDGTPNVRVIFTVDDGYALDNAAVVDLGTVTGDVTFGIGNDYKVPHAVPAGAVSYLDWDAESETLTNATVAAGEWTLVTDETRTLGDGWYVVAYDVALPVGSNIVVNGSAHLILCDGARLSVTGGYDQAAIEVSRTDAVTNTLAIYGQAECTGRLTAQGGGNHAAGIGTGLYGNCGALTINGGTVTANGGFGNGWFGRDGLVAINDGKVTASGIKGCSAVIRGGIFGTAVPDAWCADHRGVFRNLDPATSTEFPYAVLPAWKVTIGDRQHMTVEWTSDDELMTNAVEGTSFKVRRGERNVRVIFTVDSEYVLAGDPVVYVGTVNSDIVFGVGNDFKAPHAGVPYLDWDETNRVMTNAVSPVVCDVYSTSIRDLQDGHWYVVKGEHTIREYSGLRVSGDVHIILCDGSSLSIVLQKHTDGGLVTEPGIEVGEGSSLTVYGQVNGSGRLVAVGGDGGAAGIGGREGGACGAVTINGGEVSSAGGSDYGGGASGIGTGDGGYGGSVTINGGKVTASGNEYGAGIGADYRGRNMTVIINGGTVTATGGADGASIKGDNVTINDGAINVGNMGGVIAVFGGVFWAQPQDGWLATARSVVPNMDLTTADTHPWRVVESATVVSLDAPIGPFDTAEEATNAMATAAFAPSEEIVSRILLRGVSPRRYSEKFGFGVTSKGEGEWYVEAALTDAAKAYLAETATNATRQIPVAEIAEYDDETIHGFWVQDCEPGFYYTLYCADDVRSLPEKGTKCGPEMCFEDGKLMFNWVDKPSDAAGFFTIGVSAAKGE